MNQILSGLAGALILAALYGTLLLARKIGKGASALTAAMEGIPQLVRSNMEVAKSMQKFSVELEFLRTAMVGGTPEEGAQGSQTTAPAHVRPRGGPVAQFPAWQPFVAAVDVPDAEESDTVVTDTTDEEFVEQEAIETIRGQGFAAGPEADPTENPPGVTASV